MSLDYLGVLTVGTLVPKGGGHTLPSTPCLPFPPGLGSHRSLLAPGGHQFGAYPMQHVLNRALTSRMAADLISGHPDDAGNHRRGSAGHNQGRDIAPKAADVQVYGGPSPIAGGC